MSGNRGNPMNIQQRTTEDLSALPNDWPECIRKIMAARGIKKADELTFDLAELPKPSEMLGMEAAVTLLIQALQQQWRVMIVADFDSDGATSCAVMMRGLRMMGLQQIDFTVPNRFVHGYGLTTELLNEIAAEDQPDLLITVDNGIASLDGVALAKQRGMQVLITDHHLAAEQLPQADAIVNPNQPDDNFPSKMLAGVGVAFYVLLGLRQGLRDINWFELQKLAEPRLVELLDLVALGTVADVVPLDRLNRTLVDLGLKRMRQGRACAGIRALLQIAGKDLERLSAQDLGFAIAPRLNAAGRMEDMGLGIDTLLTDNFAMAQQAAQLLDQINLERRSVEQGMQLEALAMLEKLQLNETSQATAYCLYEESWHQGVIGLLASRIKEKLHRPVIVFAPGEPGEIKGSARSITGVHIRDVLVNVAAKYPDLILRFGGHAMAAGLTLKQNDFSLFEQAFREAIQLAADPTVFERALYSDGELSAQEMNMQLAEQLPVLAPWGQAFPEPQFHGQFVLQNYRHVGQQSDHLRLTIKLDDGREITAMAFRQTAPVWLQIGQKVGLHYRLDVNEFRQTKSLQLLVDNILPI
ncbi:MULTISPECIES: single-stranded-DNA-specific exonuclease RecJ [unclassified Methylophaga]|uniref:single-stranded-DNA-specific exonuclease RecJ n=1 Tax=unclassified Methylophaga TaxID=2629249 RepID=UPI0025DEC0F2|nr:MULTISPECIES: single-stranded-DNA-specific exonuclease RecJ [unclassified Methylophaga]|tara:strand:+ start:42039 stop:43787 length:1749 start_codon:yes stop_codon:yes gene_type:complete